MGQKNIDEGWDYVIMPKRRWLDIDLKGLWRYRDLGYMYVKRTFITTYKQTVLGPLWFIIQPLLTIVVYMFIFGGLAGISTEGVPQPLFYMAGIMLWNYFTDCFNGSSNVFVNNYNVFGKVYFPRLILPVSGLVSSLMKLTIQIVLFIVIYVWCMADGAHLTVEWTLCLAPVFIAMLALHALSWGLLVSSITYKYRDFQILISFVLQLLMYATPVVYPLDVIPEKYRFIVSLNPLSPIFEAFKHGCFGAGTPDWGGLLYSAVFLVVALFLGVIFFNRVERVFMDTV